MQQRSFVIIGAGAMGLASHLELQKQGVKPENVTHLEAEPHVGGKCNTDHHPDDPNLVTEMGATWVASNYHEVIKQLHHYRMKTETTLPNHHTGIPFTEELAKKTTVEKMKSIMVMFTHLYKYTREARRYQRERFNPSKTFLEDFYLPFATFAEKFGMTQMIDILKPIVSGFNYRSMAEVPAHAVFSYTGQTMAWELFATYLHWGQPFQEIQGGYQSLMEKMAADLNIITSANITHIERNNHSINVVYMKDGNVHSVTADTLIIATSPLKWLQLGMELTDIEKDCLAHLSYSRYVVCSALVTGIQPEHYFFRHAMEDDNFLKNQQEITLITTRDNRQHPPEGRLCTLLGSSAPRTLHSPPIDEQEEREIFMQKVREIAEKNGWQYQILNYKVWDDYMPTLPAAQSYALQKAQNELCTYHFTSALPGGFEDIEKTIELGKRETLKMVGKGYRQTGYPGLYFRTPLLQQPAPPVSELNHATFHRSRL